jgi:RNA polymerase sigma-70 factor (ECF subfamily)
MMEENRLWNRFIQGDNKALGVLYAELFEPLVFVSFYLVKDNEVARDIVGDLFVFLLSVEVKERKAKWKDVNTVKTYLSVAVRNKSIDYLRKTKRNSDKTDALSEKFTLEENPFFAEVLTFLKDEEKEAFQLHLDGYKNIEIAEKQQLTEKTVRNKLSLTRKKMRTYFKSLLIFFA